MMEDDSFSPTTSPPTSSLEDLASGKLSPSTSRRETNGTPTSISAHSRNSSTSGLTMMSVQEQQKQQQLLQNLRGSIDVSTSSTNVVGVTPSKNSLRKRRSNRQDWNLGAQKPDEIVKLNIGGKVYVTSRSTLLRIPNTFFSALLGGEIPSVKDEQNAYFIDREGRWFEPVLNFLRTDNIIIPPTMSRDAVMQEADYYCIEPLIRLLEAEEVPDACGGRHFESLLKGPSHSKVIGLQTMEMNIVALLENGELYGWEFISGGGWRSNFVSSYLTNFKTQRTKGMAFLKRLQRWFLAVVCDNGAIYIWNKPQEQPHEVQLPGKKIDAVFFVKRGQELVCCQYDSGELYLVSVASWAVRKIDSGTKISYLTADSDNLAAYCSCGNTIFQVMIGHHQNTCLQQVFTDPDGEIITCVRPIASVNSACMYYGTATGSVKKIQLLASEWRLTLSLKHHIHPISDLLLHRGGSLISMCSRNHVRVWNEKAIKMTASYTCFNNALMEPLLIQADDRRVDLLDVSTGLPADTLYSVTGSVVSSFVQVKGFNFLITGHADGSIQLWNTSLLATGGPQSSE